jgi:hypothetical protein
MVQKNQAVRDAATARGRHVGIEPAAANDIPPGATVITTAAQLSHLIRSEVLAAIEESGAAGRNDGPHLLDRHELAAALRVSPSSIDKLRRRGMPHRKVGDSSRFELQAVLDWLDTNQQDEATA